MAQRKQVDDLPGLGQASAPASSPQGVIAFAPRTSPLLELAQSLGGVSRRLDSVFDKRLEEIEREETLAGRVAAMKDEFKSWSDMVAAGKAPPSEHPAFFTAYEQQKGRVSGQAYTAFINDKMVNWEGSGSDDMSGGALLKVMPEWRKEFFDSVGQQSDEFMTGVMAYAEQAENNVMSAHIADARRNAESNLGTQVYNEFYNLVSDRELSKDELFARIDQVYARQEYIGLRNKVGPLLLQAVTDYAVENGDIAMIDKVREYTRKDGKTAQSIPVLKNTKATAVLDKARADAARSVVTLDNMRRTQEDRAKRDTLNKGASEAIKAGGNINPIDFAKAEIEKGADPADALSMGNTIASVARNGSNFQNGQQIDRVFFEMMTNPDPNKNLKDYLTELQGFNAGRSELVQAETVYTEYIDKGRTVFDSNPDLQAVAAQLNTSDFRVSAEEKNQNIRDIVSAARRLLPNSKARTPAEFAAEVKKSVEATRKAREEAEMKALSGAGDDGSATMMAPSGNKASASPTGDRQSNVALPPVATSAEILALSGKPVEVVDRFLASRPLFPANEMGRAFVQIRNGGRGAESERLRRAMERIGINTTDMRAALLELMRRGQAKFYAAAPKQTPPKK